MVAKSPTSASAREKRAAAALLGGLATGVGGLNPALIRETLKKVDRCVARLQELQYTVAGGRKVVGGTSLSPRSTRGYIRTSLRCKQESVSRLKSVGAINVQQQQRSPTGKFPAQPQKEWWRMSLPAMLLGETVLEIVKASEFAKQVNETVTAAAAAAGPHAMVSGADNSDPKTPIVARRGLSNKQPEEEDQRQQQQLRTPSSGLLRASRRTRDREKLQRRERLLRATEPRSPAPRKARARITFKPNSPPPAALPRHCSRNKIDETVDPGNMVLVPGPNSSYNHPAAAATRKTAVLFPNPTFRTNSATATTTTTSPPSRLRSLGNNAGTTRRTTQPPPPQQRFKSPTIIPGMIKRGPAVKARNPPHKFLIKSPPSARKTPVNRSPGKFQVRIRSPPPAIACIRSPVRQQRQPSPAVSPPHRRRSFSPSKLLRRSFSPSRLASRLVSPLKSRISAVAAAATRRKSITTATMIITATASTTRANDHDSLLVPPRAESFTTPVRHRKQPRAWEQENAPINLLHRSLTLRDRPPPALAV